MLSKRIEAARSSVIGDKAIVRCLTAQPVLSPDLACVYVNCIYIFVNAEIQEKAPAVISSSARQQSSASVGWADGRARRG